MCVNYQILTLHLRNNMMTIMSHFKYRLLSFDILINCRN